MIIASLYVLTAIVSNSTDPVGWMRIDPSELGSAEMNCVNNSTDNAWAVKWKEGTLSVSHFDYAPSEANIPPELKELGLQYVADYQRYEDGWMVAIDKGEWGGALRWLADGYSTKIHDENTRVLIQRTGYLIAAGGLSHGVARRGFIMKLSRNIEEKWKKMKYFRTETSVQFVVPLSDEAIYILGSDRAYKFDWNKGIIAQSGRTSWSEAYPNSIAVAPDNTMYLGMRHAVAELSEKDGIWSEEWLVRGDCPRLRRLPGQNCVCVEEAYYR